MTPVLFESWLLPPPPEPPPLAFPVDLIVVALPLPKLPDPSDHLGAPDLLSSLCRASISIYMIFRLKPQLWFLSSVTPPTSIVLVTFSNDSIITGLCFGIWFYYLNLRIQSLPLPLCEDIRSALSLRLPHYEDDKRIVNILLPQYEAAMRFVNLHLPQVEVSLPLYEVVIQNLVVLSLWFVVLLVLLLDEPRLRFRKIEGFTNTFHGPLVPYLVWQWRLLQFHTSFSLRFPLQFSSSSRRCFATSIAKFRAAPYVLGAAAGLGNRALCWCFKYSHMRTINKAFAALKQVPLGLVAEAFAIKAALIAVHNAGSRRLNVFSDSHSLVTILNSKDVFNELKTILHNIGWLSVDFTFLSFVFVSRLANLTAYALAKSCIVNTFSTIGG